MTTDERQAVELSIDPRLQLLVWMYRDGRAPCEVRIEAACRVTQWLHDDAQAHLERKQRLSDALCAIRAERHRRLV